MYAANPPSVSNDHPLHRFFAGLVESSLYADVGVCDPSLAAYLVELLMDFIHVDHIFALRDGQGRPLDQLAEMLSCSACPPGTSDREHRRRVHRHIGDFTLFWTGVYPDDLRRRTRRQKDELIDYLAWGKRSYAIASDLSDESTPPPRALLRRLSDCFEQCVYGLSLVRRGWRQQDPAGFAATRAIWS